MPPKLLIATNNPGKVAEYRQLLADLPLHLTTPAQERLKLVVVEDGSIYTHNAVRKATAYASASGLLTLADDSGIEVDALSGRPGIHSARYGGPDLSDSERVLLLLKELKGVPWEKRACRFRAVVAIAWPNGRVETCEGTVEGIVAYEPAGKSGFGYDPIFYLPDRGLTMAQLPPEDKNAISHRGQAARKAAQLLLAESISPSADDRSP